MKSFVHLCVVGLGLAACACGSLRSNTGTAPALATLEGSLTNPQSIDLSGGEVRVAVVWRTATQGGSADFNVAEDLPVQPVFPSDFTIEFSGPPPAAAMNSGSLLYGNGSETPPPTSGPSTGGPGPSAGVGTDAGAPSSSGPMPQGSPVTPSPSFAFAVGSVVAYIDRNGNGKLDLVPTGATAYVDQIVAANQDMAVAYFQGPIPGGDPLVDAFGHLPTDGYNLANIPYCGAQVPVTANPKCAVPAGPGADTCGIKMQWLPMSAPYTLTVASSPEVSSLMCQSEDSGGVSSSGSGQAGPYDPSVQPAVYPSPCDPNLQCSTDGSQYFYNTCTLVSQGLCEGTVETCTSAGYARPTPAPAGWPCVD